MISKASMEAFQGSIGDRFPIKLPFAADIIWRRFMTQSRYSLRLLVAGLSVTTRCLPWFTPA